MTMQRRLFMKIVALAFGRLALCCTPAALPLRKARAETRRRLLPADTQMGDLIYEDPGLLDTRNLPITPLERFGTTGPTDVEIDPNRWRLNISGAVTTPTEIRFSQLKALPAVERKVLLICPGAFAFHALWKGVSLARLLQQAGIDSRANHARVSGPAGTDEHTALFPLKDIEVESVFLAYAVNGRDLPRKHGYPLRVVAEGFIGADWIKFVDHVEAVVSNQPPDTAPPSPGPAFLP